MQRVRTLVLIKPDGVRRGLIGEIINRFERKGLKIVALKMMKMDEALADRHYDIHRSRAFFQDLKAFMTSGPIVAAVVEGPDDTIVLVRTLMGATSHLEAAPGSIRGDFATSTQENLVHGADSPERAEFEIGLFFSNDEIFSTE
ncbi:MAG: nucleoside-diphosphate kinase [Candidatus Sumerlaeia bacterium]